MGTNESGDALGEYLRSGRQRAGLTLEQISAETRIPVRHLRALEAEDLSVLPGGLYRRAEIRAYARVVGVDQGIALERLERLLQPPRTEVVPQPPKMRFPIGSPRKIAAVVVVVAGSLAFGLVTKKREASVAEPTHGVQLESAAEPHPQPAAALDRMPETAVIGTASQPQDQAPVPPHEETELVIVSEPPGARVTVDGIGWGETPVSVRNLPPGARRIRVTKAGFNSEERVAPLSTDHPTTIRIPLQTKPD